MTRLRTRRPAAEQRNRPGPPSDDRRRRGVPLPPLEPHAERARRRLGTAGDGHPVVAGCLAGLAALLVSLGTLSPDAWFGDVAEFHTLAATGGIAHAGYPAFVMLLQAFGHIPISTIAYRANLVSALAGALGVGLAGFAAARLTRSMVLGALTAIALALSLTVWYNATHASVHAFTLPISAGLFLLALRLARAPSAGLALGAGVLAGLGLVSHLSVLGLVPVAIATIWIVARERRLRVAHVGAAVGGVLIGLMPLAYLLAQDRPDQPMNYIEYIVDLGSGQHFPVGTPRLGRVQGAIWLLSGRQYFGQSDDRPSRDLPRRLSYLALDLGANEFPLVGLPLAALGVWALWRRRSRIAWMLGLWLGSVLALLAWSAYPNILRSFFLPGLWAISLFIAAGLGAIRAQSRTAAVVAGSLLVLAPIARLQVPELPGRLAPNGSLRWEVWREWPQAWSPFRPDVTMEGFGRLVMGALKPRAVVLCTWNEGMALRYFRYADVLRADVDVVITGMNRVRVERAIVTAQQIARPVYLTFPPASIGLDGRRVVPASGRLQGYLWAIRGPGEIAR